MKNIFIIKIPNESQEKNVPQQFTRNDFMAFFRNGEKLNTLSADDRIEVFSQILSGSSDFTIQLLNAVLSDYNVSNIEINEKK